MNHLHYRGGNFALHYYCRYFSLLWWIFCFTVNTAVNILRYCGGYFAFMWWISCIIVVEKLFSVVSIRTLVNYFALLWLIFCFTLIDILLYCGYFASLSKISNLLWDYPTVLNILHYRDGFFAFWWLIIATNVIDFAYDGCLPCFCVGYFALLLSLVGPCWAFEAGLAKLRS